MMLGRRQRAAVVAAVLVALTGCSTATEPGVAPVETSAPVPAPAAAPPSLSAGQRALVTVAVAAVWNAPGLARPVDAPSVGNPVDIPRWIAAMTLNDKLWLVDRLVTQALYGERVVVQELAGEWARVVVTGQPTSLDPRGYPGWVPSVQLQAGDAPLTHTSTVVTRPTAPLRDATGRPLLELSYNTRLPVVELGATDVTVALPGGGRGLLAVTDVEVAEPGPQPTSGAALVAGARLFSGLPYLWAGTSAAGFDCSGFTAALYGVHGIVLPRDADDQAGLGTPVDRSRVQPGDLLFFSSTGEQGAIHHVSMYVGGGMMIQAPATGRTVETVPVDTEAYAPEFWGARRYIR